MTLTDINKQSIINTFDTLHQFNRQMNFVIKNNTGRNRVMLQSIKIYYNNIFEYDVNMADDVLNLQEIAFVNIKALKELYRRNPIFIYKFLFERIQANLAIVTKVRMLA